MKNSRMRTAEAAVALVGAMTMGLGACSSDTATADISQCDVTEDLENARQTVIEAQGYGTWTQVMLASDVKEPTQKYGLLVMPFVKSDAAETVTGTVDLDGDKFIIDAKSKANGVTCRIDQDGQITVVEEKKK